MADVPTEVNWRLVVVVNWARTKPELSYVVPVRRSLISTNDCARFTALMVTGNEAAPFFGATPRCTVTPELK